MGNYAVLGLILIYAVLSAVLTTYTLYKSKFENRLTYITLVRAMWVLIFGIVPLLVHSYVYFNGSNHALLLSFDYSETGILQFYFASLFSVIGFIGLNLGYRFKLISTNKTKQNTTNIHQNITNHCTNNVLSVSAFIMFAIGLFSLLLWTRAYGGIKGVLKYASLLRSGYDTGISNSFTLFKRFAPLLQFANMIYLVLFINDLIL